LIKLAQFLVAHRAVLGAAVGEVEFPSELLEEMQDRFMVHGSHSPIELALKLRRYGRSIRDSSTIYGSIIWSEDNETVSFKTLHLNLPRLRWFIRDQISSVQELLEGLLFVPSGYNQDRGNLVPQLNLRKLREDASVDTPGWSFLDDPRNIQLQGKGKWLLDRVCNETTLQNRFMRRSRTGLPVWEPRAVKAYLSQVAEFLGRLLLLIHITNGQPARGTELLTAQ
jgi:hypothetical protein